MENRSSPSARTMTLGDETQVALCLYQGSTMVSNLGGCYFSYTVNEHTMEKNQETFD